MAEAFAIDEKWSWLQVHAHEPIHCETFAKEEDVVYSGSEDEHYDNDATERQRRYEERARQFLAGQAPFILTASLRGPFEQESGWTNPWRAVGGRVINQPTAAPAGVAKRSKPKQSARKSRRRTHTTAKPVEVDQDLVEAAQEAASHGDGHDFFKPLTDVSHLAEGSLASGNKSPGNPYMDETELARVQDWRADVDSKALPRESFWMGKPAETRKRASDPEWLRKKVAKRSRLTLTDDTVESLTQAVLQAQLARGATPSVAGSITKEDKDSSEHTFLTAQSPVPARPPHPLITLSSPLSDPPISIDSTSIDVSSQDNPMSGLASTDPRDLDTPPQVGELPRVSWAKSRNSEEEQFERKDVGTHPISESNSSHMTRRSRQVVKAPKTDKPVSPKAPVLLDHERNGDNPGFESQQDDSFYFRTKSRPPGHHGEANNSLLSVHTHAAQVVMPILPELPEFPELSQFSGLVSHERSDPAVLQSNTMAPGGSCSVKIRPRRAVGDSSAIRQRISIGEPTIVELGSPDDRPTPSNLMPSRTQLAVEDPNVVRQRTSMDERTIVELGSPVPLPYADLKASPTMTREAMEVSPTSSSDLSDVASFVEADCNHSPRLFHTTKANPRSSPIPSQYATIKGPHGTQAQSPVVRSQNDAVPSRFTDLEAQQSRKDGISNTFMNDTTLLPSHPSASAIPQTFEELKERQMQPSVSAVSETYADIKNGQTQTECPAVPETYSDIKDQHTSQPGTATPLTSRDDSSETKDNVEGETLCDSKFKQSVASPILPPPDREAYSLETSSQLAGEACLSIEAVVASGAQDHVTEGHGHEAGDRILVTLPVSQEANGLLEGSPSAHKSESSTQSASEASSDTTSSRPATQRLGTQDQSPWVEPRLRKLDDDQVPFEAPPQLSNAGDADLTMASLGEVTVRPDQSENQSPWKSQELASVSEAPMPCFGSSFNIGVHSSQNSQDLPSPLPDRSVLTLTSGNRMQSLEAVQPSTPDAKQSSLPTPDFTLSIKSFRRLLSASPERRPSARTSIGSILSNPWTRASRTPRRVHFAPLPGEDSDIDSSPTSAPSDDQAIVNDEDYIEAGLPKQSERRRIRVVKPEITRKIPRRASPPPIASLEDLPDEVDRFHKHYGIMKDRRGSHQIVRVRKSLLPSASQQIVGSPAVEAMADRFLAAEVESVRQSPTNVLISEELGHDGEAKGEAHVQEPAEESQNQAAEPAIDDVSAVLDNLDDFLTVIDVDKELDLARTESSSAGRRRSVFTAGLELDVNVWD